MNSVQILGNLARDPEVRYTKTGKAVASFTVAASNSYFDPATKEQREMTSFINCVAWGKLGENVGNLRQGNRCFVEGRLQTRSYETQDGQKRYVTEVVANFVAKALEGEGPSTSAGSSNFDAFRGSSADGEDIPF